MSPTLFQKALELAAGVKDPVTAAVFAAVLACAAFGIALKKKDRKTVLTLGIVLGVGIILLGALPLLAETYLKTHGGYEVRVTVLGVDGSPVEDAEVVCAPGGEQKRVPSGWECDVAPWNRPADGAFTAYATVKSAFLAGKAELRLGEDYRPVLQVRLESPRSAELRGEVKGSGGRVLPGAWVSVVGHEEERVQTGAGGGFVLPAHAATGQMIKVHAEASRYPVCEAWEQAGDSSVSIELMDCK